MAIGLFNTSLHGRSQQGPTRGRPANNFGGGTYFDEELGVHVYWDSEAEEYRPMGPAIGSGPMPQALVENLPGCLYFDGTRLTMSDGENEYSLGEVM